MRTLLRWFSRLAYLGLLMAVFILAGYFAFNGFVRRGVLPVPDVVGRSLDETQALLQEQGLRLDAAEQVFDNDVPVGHVVRQEPSPSSFVKANGTIRVVLSRDLAPLLVVELRIGGVTGQFGHDPGQVDAGGVRQSLPVDLTATNDTDLFGAQVFGKV